MKYDPIEQARLIYEAQPTAYNASAYQLAMQLAALKAELEQDQKQLQAEIKAAKTHLAYAKRMADRFRWQPMELIPQDQFVLVFASYERKTKIFVGKLDFHSEGSDVWVFLADDKWEYPRDENGKSISVKETKIVCYATHWMPLPERPEELTDAQP